MLNINGAAEEEDLSDLYSEVSDISYTSDIDNLPNAIQYYISNGCPMDRESFKVVHYNIESITADGFIEALSDVCKTVNISVLILTETHLDNTIPNNILSLSGYHDPIRHDRQKNGRYGGGCMVFISETLSYQHQQSNQSQFYEHIWVDVRTEGKTIAINCLYRPPIETVETHQHFMKLLKTFYQSYQIIELT